jgi:N-acetyl-beta-hexosaminidase
MCTTDDAPHVIPSLREWVGDAGKYTLTGDSRLVVDTAYTADLLDTATAFQRDLQRITSLSLPLVTASAPDSGDIFLTLGNTNTDIGHQGYTLNIVDCVVIRANTVAGAFYGTQTVLQILHQDPTHSHLPKGKARDYPQFAQRAIMLDAGRKYWQMDYLQETMRRMAWLKLNVLHLHFTEWSAFRLQSDLYPELAAGETYSKTDIAILEALAKRCHIILVPEIDLPAHATAITRYDPALAFDCESMSYSRWPGGELGNWAIDYTDPRARQWMEELLHEFVPLFDGPYFHIGTDEVPERENLAACRKLVAYAEARGYPYPGDVLVEWINEVNDLVRSHGKRMQIWNWWERSPHSHNPETDIVVNAWVGAGEPGQFLDAGYQVINSPEDTHYVSPGLDLLPQNEYLYEAWVPHVHPNMLGYKICVWADSVENKPDAFFEAQLHQPRAILAERTWCGGMPPKPLAAFLELLDIVSDPL